MEVTIGPFASEPGAGKATATGCKPRGPNSVLSLFSVWASSRQCGDRRKKNSSTTTLPLKLESGVVCPEGAVMTRSGDGRGAAACGVASADAASIRSIATDLDFY